MLQQAMQLSAAQVRLSGPWMFGALVLPPSPTQVLPLRARTCAKPCHHKAYHATRRSARAFPGSRHPSPAWPDDRCTPPPPPPPLPQAQQAIVDDDLADYNNELRMGILEAYSGIFQGLPTGAAENQLRADVPQILDFANTVAADQVGRSGVQQRCRSRPVLNCAPVLDLVAWPSHISIPAPWPPAVAAPCWPGL